MGNIQVLALRRQYFFLHALRSRHNCGADRQAQPVFLAKCLFEDEIGKNFFVTVIDYKKDVIAVTANDNRLFLALSLRRQREKSGSTVREASKQLGSKSPNAYAQYERGKTNISIDKYEELLTAANPFKKLRLRIA